VASYVDHTMLKPVTTFKDVETTCEEAKTHRFPAVCIPSCYVKHAR